MRKQSYISFDDLYDATTSEDNDEVLIRLSQLHDKIDNLLKDIITNEFTSHFENVHLLGISGEETPVTFGFDVRIYHGLLKNADSNTKAVTAFYNNRETIRQNIQKRILPTISEDDLVAAEIDPDEWQIEGVEVFELDPTITTDLEFNLNATVEISIKILDLQTFSPDSGVEYLKARFDFLCENKSGNLDELRGWAEDIGVPDVYRRSADQLCGAIAKHYEF
jgi:hypothetical protein